VDEVQMLREGVAKENGISLYKRYSEAHAAAYLKIDLSTLKRMRRAGKTPFVSLGERQIRYLGIHIVDLIAFGDKWRNIPNESSKSENTGLAEKLEVPLGAGHGSTAAHDKPDALHLAQTTFRKPNKS